MMEQTEVKNKAVKGVVWTSIERFGQLGISFISDIVLARLLMPEDYGIIGMLAIFMLIAQQFMDGGLGAALVQKKDTNQIDYSTVFFWNLGISLLMYSILYLSAPFIANFFRTPLLQTVLRVQGLILIISAFSVVQVNQLIRNFKFKKIAIVTLSSSVFSLAVTITMAKNGFGVWSLVTQQILIAFIPMIIYWISNKWVPLFIFSITSFKKLFSYGFYVFMTNLITTGSFNLQGIMIGRYFSASTMGYYSKANALEGVAATAISQTVEKVSFPLYSSMQDDYKILSSTIRRINKTLSFATYPLMFILILIAKPLIVFLYTEKWSGCTLYFQILCIAGLAQCLQSVTKQSVYAIGKSKQNFNWSFIKAFLCIMLMIFGFWIGDVIGLLIGMVVYAWSAYLINACLVSKYIGLKLTRQLLDITPILTLSIVSFIVPFAIGQQFVLNIYLTGIIQSFIFCILYFGGAFLFKIEGRQEIITIIQSLLPKK